MIQKINNTEMKKMISVFAIAITTTTIYNSNINISARSQNSFIEVYTVPMKEIVSSYLQLKNALADDNSAGAATSGKKLEEAIKIFDKSAMTEIQKKIFEDVEADAREHAEHIGANRGNIAHQREHFVLLSKDIYDLVKAFGGGQVLFWDFDSTYNKGKGAYWLSETQEIKNPYMGKAMLTNGSVKEEIK